MASRQPSRSDPTILQVFIFREGRFWGTECFAQSQITLGRSPDVDLQLDDDVISRSHASITVTAEGLVLEDLGSSNGTYVNGEAIERCFVDARDEVSIGVFTLKFKMLGKKKPEARFHDETRMVDRETMRDDQTEVVSPHSFEAPAADESTSRSPEPESPVIDDTFRARREAVLEEVRSIKATQREREAPAAPALQPEQPTPFELPTTDRLSGQAIASRPPEERRPAQRKAEALPPPPVSDIGPSEGLRWLTPEPDSGGEMQLADQLEPEVRPSPVASVAVGGLPFEESVIPEQAVAPLGAEASEEGEEDDEDDEREFVEPFSLLNNLVRDNFSQPQVPTQPTPVVEVIGYSPEKKVLGYEQVEVGGKHRIGSDKFVLVQYNSQGSCKLMFNDTFSGGVITGGRTVPINELKAQATRIEKRRSDPVYAYKLSRGDYANLVHEGGGSFLRFVNPPRLPKVKTKVDPTFLKSLGSAVLAHLMLGGLFALMSSSVAAGVTEADRFAKVDLKDIQMEKPKDEEEVPLDKLPPPEPKQEEILKKDEPKEKPKPTKEEKVKPDKKAPHQKDKGSGGDNQPPGAGMMAALGNLSKKAPATNIVAAVSNLDAVRVPGGKARFKVSGVVTKLPTSSVVLSRGTGVGVKADIDLLRGGKGGHGAAGIGPGALTGGTTGKRGVGGVVFAAPKHKMQIRGQLSREEIDKVVRAHLREIQYCYEKTLMLTPNIAGKVSMEWTISITGAVSIVKVSSSTLSSPAVAMCISARIREWKFPAPRGGIVVVTYPFIFNQVGF